MASRLKYLIIAFNISILLITLGPFFALYIGIDNLNPFGRNYQLTGTDIAISLEEDGLMHVNESIDYKFKGCYNEVYRDLNVPRHISAYEPYAVSAQVSCPNGIGHDRGYELACSFTTICPPDTILRIDAGYAKAVVIAKDTAILHYKIWGDQWAKDLEMLHAKIKMPKGIQEKDTTIFFSPRGAVENYEIKGNTIDIYADNLNTFLEIRLLMPKEAFRYQESDNFIFEYGLTKQEVIDTENTYTFLYNMINISLSLFYITLLLLAIIVPFIIYRRYGREPKIQYTAIYEREPIKRIKPYIISSICVGKTGDTDANAIIATLLDLVRRKHIHVEQRNSLDKGIFKDKTKKEIVFIFKHKTNDIITLPEKLVFEYFKSKAENNELVWSKFIKTLTKKDEAYEYLKLAKDFEDKVDKSYELRQYFNEKGSKIFKTFCWILFATGIISFFISMMIWKSQLYPILNYLTLFSVFLILYSVIGILIPNKVFGSFTEEGYLIYNKSMNFKRFMTDMTLLKKYPPASIIIWDEILVYATVFGIAKEVIKNMKIVVDEAYIHSSTMYPLYSYQAIRSVTGSFSYARSTVSSSSSSSGFSGGGFSGGGFGGGGGGAR